MDRRLVVAAAAAAVLGVSVALLYANRRRRCRAEPSDGHKEAAGIRQGLSGLIGDTPMVQIESLSRETQCTILAKAELLNPGGSSKVGPVDDESGGVTPTVGWLCGLQVRVKL